MLMRMRLAPKIALWVLAVNVFTMILNLLPLMNLTDMARVARAASGANTEIYALTRIRSDLTEMRMDGFHLAALRMQHAFTGVPADAVDPVQDIRHQLQVYQATPGHPSLGAMGGNLEAFIALDQQVLGEIAANRTNVAFARLSGPMHNSFQTLKSEIKGLQGSIANSSAGSARTLTAMESGGWWQGALWTAVVFVIWQVAAYFFGWYIRRAMARLTPVAKAIAQGEVDGLDPEMLRKAPRDEIGDLSRSFADMVDYLKEMTRSAEEISRGNLRIQVAVKGPRDTVGRAFSGMVTGLQEFVRAIRQATDRLAATLGETVALTRQIEAGMGDLTTASRDAAGRIERLTQVVGELHNSIAQIAAGAQEQSENLGTTSQAVSEVSGAITDMARRASGMAHLATTTRASTQTGESAVETMSTGMAGIQDVVRQLAERMGELAQSSQSVGDIVQIIADIADQTNLLALNATIEAARAGEHGRGFAVVADEVRRLAERTRGATGEISSLIGSIQQGSQAAIAVMGQVEREAGKGSQQVQAARDSFREVQELILGISRDSEEMDRTTKRLSGNAERVVGAMESLASISEENSAVSDQMAGGSSEVTGTIQRLAEMVRQNALLSQNTSASSARIHASMEELSLMADGLRQAAGRFEVA